MNTANVKCGDLVLCDIKGRRFHAQIEGVEPPTDERPRRTFDIRPIAPNISYRHAKSNEIVKHWRASRRRGA